MGTALAFPSEVRSLMLSLHLPTRSSALPQLRRAVQDWADARGIEPFPLTLVAVELTANAIAAATPDGHIELVVRSIGTEVEVRVVDDGPGFDGPMADGPGASLPPVSNERGRGLYLVRQLSRELHVGRSNGRTIVRAMVRPEIGSSAGEPVVGAAEAVAGVGAHGGVASGDAAARATQHWASEKADAQTEAGDRDSQADAG